MSLHVCHLFTISFNVQNVSDLMCLHRNDIFLLICPPPCNLCAYEPNCYVYKSYIVYFIKLIYSCVAIYMGLYCIWQTVALVAVKLCEFPLLSGFVFFVVFSLSVLLPSEPATVHLGALAGLFLKKKEKKSKKLKKKKQ